MCFSTLSPARRGGERELSWAGVEWYLLHLSALTGLDVVSAFFLGGCRLNWMYVRPLVDRKGIRFHDARIIKSHSRLTIRLMGV